MNAVMGAVIAGAARVIAVDTMESRRELARKIGATDAVAPEELVEFAGLDVVIDAVGQPGTVQQAWRTTRRGGTITVVGAGRPNQIVEINAYELFHDDKRLTGSFHGGMNLRKDLPMLERLWRTKRLPIELLIDNTRDLSEINIAVDDQRKGTVLRTILTV
jgi:S-(hydroxymethyl)glutathione dehydrogenase/alcohol dehydrogenase